MTAAAIPVVAPRPEHLAGAERVLDLAIRDVWRKDGIGEDYSVDEEIARKHEMLRGSLDGADTVFLVAMDRDAVVGTVSFHPVGREIVAIAPEESRGAVELGSLYVVPERQGEGIGSALVAAIVAAARERGIRKVAFDAGYRASAEMWRRRFGEPTVRAVDYWGPGADHLVWIRELDDLG